jgi:hypothetical protein
MAKKPVTKPVIQATSESSKRVLKAIVNEGHELHSDALGGKKPNMKFPVRTLANVNYNQRDGYLKLGRRQTEVESGNCMASPSLTICEGKRTGTRRVHKKRKAVASPCGPTKASTRSIG